MLLTDRNRQHPLTECLGDSYILASLNTNISSEIVIVENQSYAEAVSIAGYKIYSQACGSSQAVHQTRKQCPL